MDLEAGGSTDLITEWQNSTVVSNFTLDTLPENLFAIWKSYINAKETTKWLSQNLFPWLFPLLCIIGSIANGCSFWVILRNRESFPRVTRQYLLIITANDFQAMTLHGCLHYISDISKKDPLGTDKNYYGFAFKTVYEFTRVYSTVGAHFFQLGLTVDCLVAVAVPMRAQQILTRKRSRILLAVITAAALALPAMYMYVFFNTACANLKFCDLNMDFFADVYLPAELFYGRIFLLAAMALGTVGICACVYRSNRTAGRINLEPNSSRHRQRSLVRISLMMVFINLLFAATCLPSSLASIFVFSRYGFRQVKFEEPYSELKRIRSIIYVLMLVASGALQNLLYLNNALSWPVYFMSRNFYRAFCRTFVPVRWRRRAEEANRQERRTAVLMRSLPLSISTAASE